MVRAFADTARAVAEEVLDGVGSRLWLLPVSARTPARADAREFALSGLDTPQIKGKVAVDIASACRKFLLRLDSLRDRNVSGVATEVSQILQRPGDEVARATDLWGVLEVVSEMASRPNGADTAAIRVVVLSDLLECMRGDGRRCFERQPPSSRAEAERWGREVTAKVTRLYRIAPNVVRRLDISLVSAALANRPQNRYVPYYWRALLEGLGVPPERVHIQ